MLVDRFDNLQEEFRRHIHDRQIFAVERQMVFLRLAIAANKILEHFDFVALKARGGDLDKIL